MYLKNKPQKGISIAAILSLIAFFIVLGYGALNYVSYRVEQKLLALLEPVQQACQNEGCPTVPQGWRQVDCPQALELTMASVCAAPAQGSAHQTLVYHATPQQFVAHWRYVSDSEFVVTGGKGQSLHLEEKQ